MNYLQKLQLWGDNHHPKWLDFIRIILGIFLCYKAIAFVVNMSYLVSIMKSSMGIGSFLIVFFGQFVVIVTLLCGILLILGMHTRLVCLIQLPILIGAVILLNRSAATNTIEIVFSVVTLLLLVCFLIAGNGPLSYNKFFHEEDKAYRDAHSS